MTKTRRITDGIRGFFTRKRGLLHALALLAVPVTFAIVPSFASAASCEWYDIPCHAAHFLTWFFELLTGLMGYIIVLLTDALIRVAAYDNFVAPGPSAVKFGWVVTRDLANMFFIVFLLIIAFATIIGYEKYAYRSNLRRLLIMAVVINFSKTICGLFIDMSQVLLLSFVNGFKAAAAGNFMRAFQIEKLLKLSDGESTYTFGLVLAMMFAFILASIAACVMLVLLVILLFRIIMLWVLIILSPIAFLTSSFPLGSDNYYAKWWGMFKANLTNGPIIAFFIWLALATAQQTGGNLSQPSEGWAPSSDVAKQEAANAGQVSGGVPGGAGVKSTKIPSEAGTSDTILSMIIMISLLFAGLKFASEAQVMGAGFAKAVRGKAEATLRRAAMAPVGFARDQVGGAMRSVGGRTMNLSGRGLAGLANLGNRVPLLNKILPTGALGAVGRRMAASGESMEESRRQETEKRWVGGAKDLAKYSPGEFGSKMRLRTANAAQIRETAEAAIGNPKALAALQKSGGADLVRDRLKAQADKDPSQKAAYDNFMKANWAGAKDETERKAILGKFSGDDAKKYMKAEDMNANTLGALSKNGVTELLQNGRPDQKGAVMATFDSMSGLGSLESLMKEKRMTYADIPAEAMSLAGDDTKGGIKQRALAAAEKDSSMMKKFADDPKMRDALVPKARENFTNAKTDIEKAQKLATLSMFGAAGNADFTPEVEVAMGQLSMKQISDLERNTPTDSPNAQAGLERILTNAMKNGTTEMTQAILRSPTLSQRVPLDAAREAEKSTSGFTSAAGSGLSAKISDVDRQRRAAVDDKDDFAVAAYAKQAEALRKLGDDIKGAARELGKVEQKILDSRQRFGEAQKVGNAPDMEKFANEIKASLKELEAKKSALAIANGEAKKVT